MHAKETIKAEIKLGCKLFFSLSKHKPPVDNLHNPNVRQPNQ